jgi:hypothetical protein
VEGRQKTHPQSRACVDACAVLPPGGVLRFVTIAFYPTGSRRAAVVTYGYPEVRMAVFAGLTVIDASLAAPGLVSMMAVVARKNPGLLRNKSALLWELGARAVESHISRKTSEMPRISCTQFWKEPRVRLSLRRAA